jgi:adenine phosphoribosyltransferase
MNYEKYIGVVEDFPKKGISFKDISPLLSNGSVMHQAVDDMSKIVDEWKPDLIIGPEARGFIFGVPVAYKLNVGFAMARKKGKLPGEVVSKTYTLEYNTETIELKKGLIKKGTKVVLIDDLLATGGTLQAVKELVEENGGEVVGALTFIELDVLKDSRELTDVPFKSILCL